MGCGIVRAVSFEDGSAVGTDIETGVGQAVVPGWDGAVFSEKRIVVSFIGALLANHEHGGFHASVERC